MEFAKEKIAEFLEQLIGLKASSIGSATLERAVASRMREAGIDELQGYFERLGRSPLEVRKLVEEVVVPETWFFRDLEPFNCLTTYVLNSEKDVSRDIFRILSLPCSTGEEPYSIVMTMLDAGLAPTSFYIDAVDVSERLLSRARQGVYRENSFRTKDLRFRENYFVKSAEGFALKKVVHDKVRFLRGNLLQTGFLDGLGKYDAVFCRNVLIYFSAEAQKQAINSLHNLLVPGGILFTGHAEASLFHDPRFVPIPHDRAFAFYKQKSASVPVVKPSYRSSEMFSRRHAPKKAERRLRPRKVPGRVPPPRPELREDGDFLQVQRLADEGRLDEAAQRSEENLNKNGPSARWFYLLGIIRDSQGRAEEAVKLLRKAVYIDPENIESLVYLSLMAERAGDLERAANYKRRAKRIQEGG